MKTTPFILTATALLTLPWALAQPVFTKQPTNNSVSLGATVRFAAAATSTAPSIRYQWWFQEAALDTAANPSAAKSILSLTNVTLAQAGAYTLVASDAGGLSASSQVATLTVDATFTKVTQGQVVTDREYSVSANACDYDGDGLQDLLVLNWAGHLTPQKLSLYHNEGGGSFTKATNVITTAPNINSDAVWADFDNDGDPDLFIPHLNRTNALYRNDGQGVFVPLNTALTQIRHRHFTSAWTDVDRDGWLDAFIGTLDVGGFTGHTNDFLFRNTGSDFMALDADTAGEVVTDAANSRAPSWCDFDDDGDMDLYVGVREPGRELAFLYRIDGTGRFHAVTLGSIPPAWRSDGAWWADVNNDGFFDLLAFSNNEPVQTLHLNRAGQTFEDVTETAGLTSGGSGWGPGFGDYDNDGDLDLFVTDYSAANVLYQNNGDGTFRSIDVGSPIRDGVNKGGSSTWADFDNDGFLDLFVACGENNPSVNLLYLNHLPAVGNTNHWLKVKLEGTLSNRQGIGAKVHMRAVIGGRQVGQVRQLASNSIFAGGTEFLAHFGLGDATQADLVRIEWPSGIVQELTNVPAQQILTITEPLRLHALGPGRIRIQCWKGQKAEAYVSDDLSAWTSLGVFTNETGTLEMTDPEAGRKPYRFYRAVNR